jgi:hypothetical protein
VIPALLITTAHWGISALMISANSGDVLAITSRPSRSDWPSSCGRARQRAVSCIETNLGAEISGGRINRQRLDIECHQSVLTNDFIRLGFGALGHCRLSNPSSHVTTSADDPFAKTPPFEIVMLERLIEIVVGGNRIGKASSVERRLGYPGPT